MAFVVEHTEAKLEWSFSPMWTAVAVASMVALAVVAPGGLYLLGFLGVIILAHEAGHLLMARRAGMVPTEYFWGFGPEVAAVQVGQCRYGIKVLFLGGYVKLEGMTPTSELPEGFAEVGTYRAASHRGRLATILAGPATNIVLALVAFTLVGLRRGMGPVAAVGRAAGDVWYVTRATAEALAMVAANLEAYLRAVFDFGGTTEAPVRFLSPVGQASVSGQAIELGVGASLQWFAILSCAVGIINLLPLPPLDGSHAVVAAVEGIVQRLRGDRSIRLDVARLLPLAYVTVGLLVVLSATALVLDVRDLVL